MSRNQTIHSQSRRQPLSDTTLRSNNTPGNYAEQAWKSHQSSMPHHESVRPNGRLQNKKMDHQPQSAAHSKPQAASSVSEHPRYTSHSTPNPAIDSRLALIYKEHDANGSNRNSQISNTSTNASDAKRRKTHIGPWQLGKTLGKGATARVRLARHSVTGRLAAIKIVQKKNAKISQAGSLASLDRMDIALPDPATGFRKMPYSIEREVAIMKLIDNPNVISLYDIWENRTEIYLVLEHVDDGELFEHISRDGGMDEEPAMRFFRQIMNGITCLHGFGICHRDLKPENILIDKKGVLKIADFGMAALMQTPDYMLDTSCGSPHYAAPEVIRNVYYKGTTADIWSMGVILYATLSGHLPFDMEDVPDLLRLIKSGKYAMPQYLSREAKDLIYRMLQVDPAKRIDLTNIWRHPLFRKYDHLDDLGRVGAPTALSILNCGRPLLRRSDIDWPTLRHLRSMWHSFDEQKIVDCLLDEKPNEQKLFYALLMKHRENQLENYVPDINYSNSDYHHAHRPLGQVPKLSTRQFVDPQKKGHSRQVSRFTVVSNVSRSRHSRKSTEYAATEGGETVKSYDPYNVARTRHLTEPTEVAEAKIVIHRGRASLQESLSPKQSLSDAKFSNQDLRSLTKHSNSQTANAALVAPRTLASRSSLASSSRSRSSAHVVRAAMAHRRGVSFPHSLKNTHSNVSKQLDEHSIKKIHERHSKFSEVTDNGEESLHAVANSLPSARYIRSRKASNITAQQPLPNPRDRGSKLWHEDVRQLSSSLAKDCDEAFNRSSVVSASTVPTPVSTGYSDFDYITDMKPMSIGEEGIPRGSSSLLPSHFQMPIRDSSKTKDRKSKDRPLPPPPARSHSTDVELLKARRKAELSNELTPRHINKMVSHIDGLLDQSSNYQDRGRRVTSAPVTSPNDRFDNRQMLQAINENSSEDASPRKLNDFEYFLAAEGIKPGGQRNSSAPQPGRQVRKIREGPSTKRESNMQNGVRLVLSSSPSPPLPPAPLQIRKRSSQGSAAKEATQSSSHGPAFSFTRHTNGVYATDLREPPDVSSQSNDEDNSFDDENSTSLVEKKRSNWFARKTSRSSKADKNWSVQTHPSVVDTVRPLRNSSNAVPELKREGIVSRLFKGHSFKWNKRSDELGFKIYEGDDASFTSLDESSRHRISQYGEARQIQTHQNWLQRMFRVKPAKKHLCFSVSKHRARREVASILREWKKYGVRDVLVDKDRNMIFGRVSAKNYLHLKEVSFACEIMTVIEHGKRSPLSIVRFTQEKGAASSFLKVVETLETVLKSRGMLVSDDRKRRMMIKTLQYAR